MTPKTKVDNLHLSPSDEADFMKAFFAYRKAIRQLQRSASRISLSDHIRLRILLSSLSAEYGFEAFPSVLPLS
jgi:hypothetical protein